MPDKMSQEKISHLRAFGARVVVCPTAVEPEDPRSYYQVAQRIADETPNCFYANQYHNPANPEAHYLSSGPGDLGADGRRVRRVLRRHGHRRNDQRHGQVPQGEEARHPDRRRRSGGLALLRLRQERAHHQALLVQGRGHRRGLLPDDDEPQDPRRHRPRRRQGVLPDDARPHAPRGALRRRLGRRGGGGRDEVRAAHGRAAARTGGRPARAHPRLPGRRAGTSTCRRSSTTTGCARTASSRTRPGLGTVRDVLAGREHASARHRAPRRDGARRHRADEGDRDQPAPGRRGRQAARHRRRGRPAPRAW